MAVHWGGRGFGHRSRWTAAASGGTPTPPITLIAPAYFDNFDSYADGYRLVAGDPNANAGLVATNPGNLGWSAFTDLAADNSRFQSIIYQGKVLDRTANTFSASTYVLSPNVAISGWQTVRGGVTPQSGQQSCLTARASNQKNRLTLRNNNAFSVNLDQVIAGTLTTPVSVSSSGTARKMGGLHGAIRAFNDSNETLALLTFYDGSNYKAVIRRGPGFPVGPAAGTTFTDPAGTYFGFGSGSTSRANSVDWLEASQPATVMFLTETFNTWYPKRKAAAGDAVTTGSAAITFSGTYFGTAPSRLQWALFDPETGATVKDWAWVPTASQTIGGGSWSVVNLAVPVGLNGRKAYAIGFRPVDAANKADAAAAVVSVKHFYVALNIALIGQSNSSGLTNTMTSGNYADYPGSCTYQKADPPLPINGVTFNECTNYYLSTTNQTSDKCTARLGDILSTQLNIPVCFEVMAIPATGAANLGPLGTNWTYITTHHANAGGAFEMLYLSQGENEFSSAGSTWLTQWVDTNLPAYLALSGQPSGTVIPIFLAWTGRQTSGVTNDASTGAMRTGQDGFVAYANAQLSGLIAKQCHHYVGCKMLDNLHYTAILGEGYDEVARRMALSIMKHLGASAYDGMGPIATTATRAGAVVTVDFNLNGASSMTCRNGTDQSLTATASALTSWQVSTDDFATTKTISSAALVGDQVVLTLSADPGGPVKVRNHYTANPDVTSWAFGAYADGSYIGSKPIITPLVSN